MYRRIFTRQVDNVDTNLYFFSCYSGHLRISIDLICDKGETDIYIIDVPVWLLNADLYRIVNFEITSDDYNKIIVLTFLISEVEKRDQGKILIGKKELANYQSNTLFLKKRWTIYDDKKQIFRLGFCLL